MFEDGTDSPVSLRWRGDRIDGITIVDRWQDKVGPPELIQSVVDQFRSHHGERVDWRSKVRLRGIPLEQMPEFARAIRAARQSSPLSEATERSTPHFRSRWRGGQLLSVASDMDWVATAPRQSIADELLELLDVDVPDTDESPDVKWLMAMMGEQRA